MSKSTPLNQLPTSNFPTPPPQQLVNEPQRQMIQNAQIAAQNFPIPQNTQMPHDIPENDSSIQDILNELNIPHNGGDHNMSPSPPPPTPQLMQMPMQMHNPIDTSQFMNGGSNPFLPMDPSIMNDFASMAGGAGGMFPQNEPNGELEQVDHKSKYMAALMSWNSDLKVAVFAVGVFILVSIIPIETYVYNYIALDKIPYSSVVIKAVLAGVILVVLLHLNR